MTKKIKIILYIILLALISICSDCFYGLLFGGIYSKYALENSFLFGVIFSLVFIFFAFRKQITLKKFFSKCIASILLFILVSYAVYDTLNDITAGSNYEYYDTEIIRVEMLPTVYIFDPTYNIVVNNKSGQEIYINIYSPTIKHNENETIKICEKHGGFGYSKYSISN